jgi:hypothetical protein
MKPGASPMPSASAATANPQSAIMRGGWKRGWKRGESGTQHGRWQRGDNGTFHLDHLALDKPA